MLLGRGVPALRSVSDGDATPFSRVENDISDDSWQVSEDLTLHWQAADDLLFTFGGMYLHANLSADNLFRTSLRRTETAIPGVFLETPGQQFPQTFDQKLDSLGVYAHFQQSFLEDHFSLEGGLRYSWTRKDFSIFQAQNMGTL